MSNAKTGQLKPRQNPSVGGGEASSSNKILLPKNSTAHLSQIPNEEASIAYDTDQQAVVINDGSGFSPVGGGGGSGTVTSVATGTGLSGGPITTTGTVSLANTAVTPGSYTSANITVDAQGRLTAAANGSGGIPVLPNDTYLYGRNAADDTDLPLVKIDATNNAVFGGTGTIAIRNDNGRITLSNASTIQHQSGATVLLPSGGSPQNITFADATNTDFVALVAPNAPGVSSELILPVGAGVAGQSLITDGNFPAQLSWAATGFSDFGDGSDGAADLDGVNTYSFVSLVGSDYYMLRQCYFTNLTVRAGIRLIPSCYSIFGTGTLTIEATSVIQANGGDFVGALTPVAGGDGGQGNAGSPGDSGSVHPAGYLTEGDLSFGSQASAGGEGTPGAGVGATAVTAINTLFDISPANGGNGGNGSTDVGGVTFLPITNKATNWKKLTTVLLSPTTQSADARLIGGWAGSGGSGGGGDSTFKGGGGGGGGGCGGVIAIFFNRIANSGTIESKGQDGADGESPASVTPVTGGVGGGGGGAGGSGGLIYMVSRTGATGATDVTGGAGGTGGTGQGVDATNGADGDDGDSGVVLHYSLAAQAWI